MSIHQYFKNDDLAVSVWQGKYAQPGEKTPDDMHNRLATEFARIEESYINAEKPNDNLSRYGKNRKPLTKDRIYDLFKNFGYIVPQGSIMSMLGRKDKIGSLSNCLHGDTKVLTRDGFIPIKELSGKEAIIMTKGGSWVKAPFKSYGEQMLYELNLKKGKSDKKTILCTLDHNWFVEKKGKPLQLVSTKDLKIGDKLHNQFSKGRSGFGISPFGIAHGIYFGDGRHGLIGNSENNTGSIALCGDARVLGKYFINPPVETKERICEGGMDRYSNIPNHYAKFPDIRENKAYLYGWLAGYFAADGNIDKKGSCAIHSTKRENIEFVKDVCGVLGIYAGEIQQQTVISNLTNRDHTMYKVFIHTNHLSEDFFLLDKHKSRFYQTEKSPAKWEVESVIATGKAEEVYCAEVPNTYSFTIEGNVLSGNCFVVGQPADSYGGILQKDEQLVQLMKRRKSLCAPI